MEVVMSRKITGAQKPFKMLVANLRQGSDPSKGTSGNPVKVRSSYESQMFPEIGGRGFQHQVRDGSTPGTSYRKGLLTNTGAGNPEFSIEFSATIAGPISQDPTRIIIGDIVVIPGVDFVVVNNDDVTTAANFGTYITNTFGWVHILAGGVATIRLPEGLDYNNILIKVSGPDSGFYTVTPESGYPITGGLQIGPGRIG